MVVGFIPISAFFLLNSLNSHQTRPFYQHPTAFWVATWGFRFCCRCSSSPKPRPPGSVPAVGSASLSTTSLSWRRSRTRSNAVPSCWRPDVWDDVWDDGEVAAVWMGWNMVKLRMKFRGQYNLIIHDWEKTLRRPLFGNFWVTWALGDWGNYLKKCWVSGDHTLIGSDDFRSSPTLQRTVAHLEMMKKSWTIRSRFHTFGHRFWALVPKRTQKVHSLQSFHASLYPLVICYIAMVV